jgi:polyhydroxyalkanoate synthesis regulator phasin
LGEVSRKQVRKVLKDLVGKGNATAEQLRTMTTELVAANAANRDALGKLIKVEVDRTLGRVGLATMDEVNELTARVRELERALKQSRAAQTVAATGRTVAPTPAAGRARATKAEPVAASAQRRGARPSKTAAAPAARPAATTAVAKKAVAKKTVAKKAVAKKAVAKKTTSARGAQQ